MPTWTDICSCNICIHHIHVDYVGKEREHDCKDAGGRAPTVGALGDAGAVAEAMREQCSGMLRNFEKMVLWGIK
ncbi:MAG: hypothetical protein ACXW00_12805 [Methylobacter sp.]